MKSREVLTGAAEKHGASCGVAIANHFDREVQLDAILLGVRNQVGLFERVQDSFRAVRNRKRWVGLKDHFLNGHYLVSCAVTWRAWVSAAKRSRRDSVTASAFWSASCLQRDSRATQGSHSLEESAVH